MNYLKKICPNMNHGKTNPPITFCPNCGEKLNAGSHAHRHCSEESHREKRKSRNQFCLDCGKDLAK